jgi:predicted PurR-regulated permease PerM
MTNVIRTTLMLAGLTGLLLLFGGFVGGRSGIFLAPPIAATIIQLAISRGREFDVESGIICKN